MRTVHPRVSGPFTSEELQWSLAAERCAPDEGEAAEPAEAMDHLPSAEAGMLPRSIRSALRGASRGESAAIRAGGMLLASGLDSAEERAGRFEGRPRLAVVQAALSAVIIVASQFRAAARALARRREALMSLAISAAAAAISVYALFGRPPSYEILPDPEAMPRPAATARDASALAEAPRAPSWMQR